MNKDIQVVSEHITSLVNGERQIKITNEIPLSTH